MKQGKRIKWPNTGVDDDEDDDQCLKTFDCIVLVSVERCLNCFSVCHYVKFLCALEQILTTTDTRQPYMNSKKRLPERENKCWKTAGNLLSFRLCRK